MKEEEEEEKESHELEIYFKNSSVPFFFLSF